LSGRDIEASEVEINLAKKPADPSLQVLGDLEGEESYDFEQYAKAKNKDTPKGKEEQKSAVGQSEDMSEDIARCDDSADDSMNNSGASDQRLQQLMVDTGQVAENKNPFNLSESKDPTNANMDDLDEDRSDIDSFAESRTEH